MALFPVDDVKRLAAEAGIPLDLFRGWEGHELGLYRDSGGVSGSLEVAQRIAREKALRQSWTMDLGNRAVALTRAQGEGLQAKLDGAGIQYHAGSARVAYMKRIHRVSREHEDVLSELAKY